MSTMVIVHQGWLTKSPPSRGIFRPRWRRRWFVLKTGSFPNQFVLEYFTDESAKRQKGSINLDECEQLVGPLSVQDRHKFTFQIRTPSRTYYLASDSETEMRKWAASLCQVCGLKSTEEENHRRATGTIVYSRVEDENNVPNSNTIVQNSQEETTESDDSSPTLSNKVSSGPYMPISECIIGNPIPKSELNDVTYCNTSVFHFPPKVNWATHPHPGKEGKQSDRNKTYKISETNSNSANSNSNSILLQSCVVAPPRPPKSKGCTAGVLVTVTSPPSPSAASTTSRKTEQESEHSEQDQDQVKLGVGGGTPYENEDHPDSSSTCSSLQSPPGSAGVVYSNISDIIISEPRSAEVRGTLLGQYSPQGSKNNSPTATSVSTVPPPVVDRNLKPLRGTRKNMPSCSSSPGSSSNKSVNSTNANPSTPTQKFPTPSYTSGTMTLPSLRSGSSNRYTEFMGPRIDRSIKPPDGHGHLSLGPTPAQINNFPRQPTGTLPSSSSSSPRAGPIVSPNDRFERYRQMHHEYEQAAELKGTYLQIDCHMSSGSGSESPKFSIGSRNSLGRKGFGILPDANNTVEYRLIDPIKTRALNKTMEDREKQLRCKNINL